MMPGLSTQYQVVPHLRILTSARPASDSAGLKAAMVGLVPTIHDGGQMWEREVMLRLMIS
jgi:hypothetical protein